VGSDNTGQTLVEKLLGKRPPGRQRWRQDNIQMGLWEIPGYQDDRQMLLAYDDVQC